MTHNARHTAARTPLTEASAPRLPAACVPNADGGAA